MSLFPLLHSQTSFFALALNISQKCKGMVNNLYQQLTMEAAVDTSKCTLTVLDTLFVTVLKYYREEVQPAMHQKRNCLAEQLKHTFMFSACFSLPEAPKTV